MWISKIIPLFASPTLRLGITSLFGTVKHIILRLFANCSFAIIALSRHTCQCLGTFSMIAYTKSIKSISPTCRVHFVWKNTLSDKNSSEEKFVTMSNFRQFCRRSFVRFGVPRNRSLIWKISDSIQGINYKLISDVHVPNYSLLCLPSTP